MTTDTDIQPVTISANAARRVAEILGGEAPGTMLRVAVNGGGCQGFSYDYSFTAAREADDHLIERDGAKVLVDPMSADYLKGSLIDWVDDLIGASFQIRNPNAKSSCGCGTSFSL
jgi:iron-sulfur cluster assembly accessory protein